MSDLGKGIVQKHLEVGDGEPTDTINRSPDAYATDAYAGAGTFEGKGKSGAYAGAGFGHARAECSAFDAEINGPNASAGYQASKEGARIMAKAELLSGSVSAGPTKATLGLALDTGLGLGSSGIELKFLGTGISIGHKTGFSWFGSGIEFDFGK